MKHGLDKSTKAGESLGKEEEKNIIHYLSGKPCIHLTLLSQK
jgi:hypothetical protein